MIILVDNSNHSLLIAAKLSQQYPNIFILPFEQLNNFAWQKLQPFLQFMPPAEQDSYYFETPDKLHFQIKSLSPTYVINTLPQNQILDSFLKLACKKNNCKYIVTSEII